MYLWRPGQLLTGLFLFVLTVDHTRVVLNDGDASEAGSDYINANIIMVVSAVSIESLYSPGLHIHSLFVVTAVQSYSVMNG